MLVVSLIEKAEVDSIPFLFGALGIVVLVVSLQPYTGGLGYRGIDFVAYGKRIWQFSNRLFGGLFTLGAFLLYLLFKLGDISAGNKVLIAIITCFICSLISDLITLYVKRQRN